MYSFDKPTYENVIDSIERELMRIIDENKGGFKTNEYKVRTEYSDSKFNLNDLNVSNDESIFMLIHRIMYVEKLYEKFLSPEHMKLMEKNPDSIYIPDDSYNDYERVMVIFEDEVTNYGSTIVGEFFANFQYHGVNCVYQKLKEENIKKHIEVISLKEDFDIRDEDGYSIGYLDPLSPYSYDSIMNNPWGDL